MTKKEIFFLPIILVLITIYTVSQWSIISFGTTYVWWVVNSIILMAILKVKNRTYNKNNNPFTWIVFLYLIWNIGCIIRGCLIAENYWEWKNLISMSFVLLLPLTIYVSTNREMVQSVFNNYIKYILPLFLVFAFLIDKIAYGLYLIPISFLLLFIPLLTNQWLKIILMFSIIGITASFAARSNVIKFIVPLIFGVLYYLRPFMGTKILGLGRRLLLLLPMILFILGLTGQFNVFKINEYIKGDFTTTQNNGETEDLTADTRTGLYIEVLASAINNNYIWLGRTPARGNDSVLFGKKIEELTGTGKFERYANEVSVLNIFTWTGLIGLMLYFLIFLRASYLALYKSSNWYMKILAVYISFRWAYAWVEDFSRFDLSYIFLWIILGMCFSTSFRSMSDKEFRYWVRGIFDIRYRKATLKKMRVNEQF